MINILYETHNVCRIKKHIALVRMLMLNIGVLFKFDKRELLKRVEKHDITKFDNDEYLGFMLLGDEKEHGRYLTQEEKYIVQQAITQHYQKNSHHPQHYNDCNEMSEIDLLEMVCDWQAISIEKKTPLILKNIASFNKEKQLIIKKFYEAGIIFIKESKLEPIAG